MSSKIFTWVCCLFLLNALSGCFFTKKSNPEISVLPESLGLKEIPTVCTGIECSMRIKMKTVGVCYFGDMDFVKGAMEDNTPLLISLEQNTPGNHRIYAQSTLAPESASGNIISLEVPVPDSAVSVTLFLCTDKRGSHSCSYKHSSNLNTPVPIELGSNQYKLEVSDKIIFSINAVLSKTGQIYAIQSSETPFTIENESLELKMAKMSPDCPVATPPPGFPTKYTRTD